MCNEEAIELVNDYFKGLEENHSREGIGNLKKCWTTCVEFQGDYIEKYGTIQNSDCCGSHQTKILIELPS